MDNKNNGQLRGPFKGGAELMNLISASFISKIGIYADEGTQISINNEIVEIGKTNMYEAGDVRITSLKFVSDQHELTFIDYVKN